MPERVGGRFRPVEILVMKADVRREDGVPLQSDGSRGLSIISVGNGFPKSTWINLSFAWSDEDRTQTSLVKD